MKKIFILMTLLLLTGSLVIAQSVQISGTVNSSEDGLPMPGVSITAIGTTLGVLTDVDGKYSISVPPQTKSLLFSFVGFKSQEIPIDGRTKIDIGLVQDLVLINEVVVVGYGTQIKSKVTGSISKVEGEVIRNMPVPTIEQALQGRTAGVFIGAVNGKSTGTTNMRIRGSSSITATNQPLFVVDGIPLTTEALNFSGAEINPLTSINFNDVESIDILKDAASSAIYGSRGANGVVIITTKKGISGDTKLNFTIQSGFNEASRRREFMNSEEYVRYFREAGINGDIQEDLAEGDPLGTSTYWQSHVETRLKRYSGWAGNLDGGGKYLGSQVDTDWQDLAFQRGKIFSADMSAQGGNDKLKYFTSLSYNNTEGILVSNGLEKDFGTT